VAGRFIVKYYGPGQTFRHISAVDVIEKKIGPKDLRDKIVLFGVTTIGVYDIRPTPFESTYPGVEIHANVIENILREDYLTRPNMLKMIEVLAMLIVGIGFGLMLSKMKLQYAVPAVLAALLASIFMDYTLLFKNGLHTRTILMYAQVLTMVMGMSVFRYFTEEREKGKIRKVFHTYISKNVAEEVLKDMSKLKLGGQKKTLTVFFSDIRGFTTISEKLSPEQLVHQLNEYLTPMTNIIISKHEGTLDKYMGDAIMAIFGAPLDQPDHALRCCNAALDMMEELKLMRAKWRNEGLPELNIGIGINTGEMIVGNMGSHVRFEYTVIGDNVNLGSRLEGTNKEYGTNIIISEATKNMVFEKLVVRELDELRVKGKKEPVKIYELRGRLPADEKEKRLDELFQAARVIYKQQKWDEAEEAFKRVLEVMPGDPPSKRYLERIAYLRTCSLDSCWDGVWDMKSK
jgi:adenylate cyclase